MKFSGLRFTSIPVAALLVSLAPAGLHGQSASIGAVFPLFETDEFCESSTLGAFQVGFETPITGSVDGQIEAYYAPNGYYPWPWTPIGSTGGGGAQQVPLAYDHDGGFRLAANALIELTEADRMSVKALVGGGVRRLGGADYAPAGDGDIERYGVDAQFAPLVTFGLVADIGLNDRMALRLQGRGNAIFSGDLQLRGATAALDRIAEGDTQTFAQAMIGLKIGIGEGR